MKLRALTVGPSVGVTTPTRVRIWGRAETALLDALPMRSFGALRVREAGGAWSKPRLFKMNPNFDMTGIGVVTQLKTSTSYEYEIGHFFSDGEMEDAKFGDSDWSEASRGRFTTASDDPKAPRSIVVGSCRYLLKTFIGAFFDDRGDKTFRSVYEQIATDGRPVHQLLMIGDQIYADDLNALNPDKTVDQFFKRYRDAFSQPHIRRLMSLVPTYMTLDDHEIEDNWPAKATEKDRRTLYPVAIHAYQTYQLSHSPNIPVQGTKLEGTPAHLWYTHADGCTEVFVTDSRTERLAGNRPLADRSMLSPDQFGALKRWLNSGSGRVKLVVTSVPFFPDVGTDENEDKWSGFPAQRVELLEFIERNKIAPVVFLSGDVHASMSAEIVSPSGVRVYSVVSSAFFWPYPHSTAQHFKRKGTIDGGKAGQFKLENVNDVVSDDNFTRLEISPQRMIVEVFDRKGELLSTKTHQF